MSAMTTVETKPNENADKAEAKEIAAASSKDDEEKETNDSSTDNVKADPDPNADADSGEKKEDAPQLKATNQDSPDAGESKSLKDLEDEAPKTFPQILMEILSSEDESDTIAWLPHGRSFIIYKKKKFGSSVLPRYFKATKFTSFTRKLNRWGFTRVTRGPEMGSYYHKLFIRDDPSLCLRMSSHSSSKFQEQQQLMPNPMPPFGAMPFGMPGMMPGMMNINMANLNPADLNQQNQLITQQLQQLQWQQFQLQQLQQQQAGMQHPHHHPPPPPHQHNHPQAHPPHQVHQQPPPPMHQPSPPFQGPPGPPPGGFGPAVGQPSPVSQSPSTGMGSPPPPSQPSS